MKGYNYECMLAHCGLDTRRHQIISTASMTKLLVDTLLTLFVTEFITQGAQLKTRVAINC